MAGGCRCRRSAGDNRPVSSVGPVSSDKDERLGGPSFNGNVGPKASDAPRGGRGLPPPGWFCGGWEAAGSDEAEYEDRRGPTPPPPPPSWALKGNSVEDGSTAVAGLRDGAKGGNWLEAECGLRASPWPKGGKEGRAGGRGGGGGPIGSGGGGPDGSGGGPPGRRARPF